MPYFPEHHDNLVHSGMPYISSKVGKNNQNLVSVKHNLVSIEQIMEMPNITKLAQQVEYHLISLNKIRDFT
jgi:hypothetical protein